MTNNEYNPNRRDFIILGTAVAAGALVAGTVGVSAATGFNEAPMLADLVKAGSLPPVADRLPLADDILVVTPTNEVGAYGGNLRSFMLNDTDNNAPFGAAFNYGLFMIPRDLDAFAKEMPQRGWVPVIAKDYQWNDDATQLTVMLRRGMKWSDGAPFTSADVMFAWHDVWFNTDMQPAPPSRLLLNGEPVQLSAPDDYTLVFDFPSPYPTFIFAAMRIADMISYPKHFLAPFHPRYTPTATLKDFQAAKAVGLNPGYPSVTPWVVKVHDTNGVIVERNPYFCGVDTAGNQLPYADTYEFPFVGTTENAVLKTIAGEIDVGERNLQFFENLPVLKEGEAQGNYQVLLYRGSAFTQPTGLIFGYNLQDPDHPELHDLLRNPQFRLALSQGIDRDALRSTVLLGLGRSTSFSLSTTSPFWDQEFEEICSRYSALDTDRANAILDELGLFRDAAGQRRYPSGKAVTIILDAVAEFTPFRRASEVLVAAWQGLGIDARLNAIARSAVQSRIGSNLLHASVWGQDATEIPLVRPDAEIFNLLYTDMNTYRDGVPLPEHVKLLELQQQIFGEPDTAKSKELLKEVARLRVETALNFHLVGDLPIMVVRSNRVGNMPDVGLSLQTFIYERPEQFYIKA